MCFKISDNICTFQSTKRDVLASGQILSNVGATVSSIVLLPVRNQLLGTFNRKLDPSCSSCALNSTTDIHCVPKELESRALSSQNPSSHRTGMNSNTKRQVSSVWPQSHLQLLCQGHHLCKDIPCKLAHNNSVFAAIVRNSRCGNIAVTNSLDLEHLSGLGNLIESSV
eukprot:Nitzschia sp. Nitz4//scaffold136_size62208//572//1299//NITZ4_006360-RA/size62208-snap-gene-0.11-mRNA-1//1//CDS//3329535594//9028//frame0